MNAMILAGGLGTRLGELGKEKPKVLMEVQGRPLLEWHLGWLESLDSEVIVINTNTRYREKFIEFFADNKNPQIICLEEKEPFGTAGSVHYALPLLGTPPFMVIYGDTFVKPFRFNRTDRTTIAVYKSDSTEDMGVVEVDHKNRVTSFVEKGSGGRGLVNAGIYILGPEIIPLLRPNSDFGYDIFPEAIEKGIEIYVQVISSVVDIGTPERLASVQ